MTMKASELRDLDANDLALRLREAKEELFNLRFQNVTSQLDNSSRLGEVRRDIARIFTVMAERENEVAGEAGRTARPRKAQSRRQRRGLRGKGRS
jgi:large subunit ribosomal protein L29